MDMEMDERIGREAEQPAMRPNGLSRRGLLRAAAVGGAAAVATATATATATSGPWFLRGVAAQDPAAVSGPLLSWGYGTENPVAAARVEAFQQAFPNVQLEMVPQYDDAKLLTAVASETVPDLLWLDRFATAGWASREVLLPLTDFIARDGYDTSRFYESALTEASYDGAVYGIPGGMNVRILYANRAHLAEVGADPATLDTANWEQLNELGAQLVRKTGDRVDRWGFDSKIYSGFLYLWGLGNGGRFVNEDGSEVTFDDPKNVEALAWGVKGADDQGGFRLFEQFASTFQGDEQFARGLVSMSMYENWMLGLIANVAPELDFAVLPIKRRDGEGTASFTGGRGWYIMQGAKNPEAAWEFIKFMHTDDNWLLAANTLKASRQAEGKPYIPSMTGSKTADQAQIDQVFVPFNPNFDEAVRLFPQVLAESPNRDIAVSPAATLLDQALKDEGYMPALRKEKEPQQALEDADTAAQDELDML